ncbi:MAG: hypothetical protein QOH38_61, partial [Thermoleophilaceae bacterium]|nr:hypothetical protein [Thermoleophilaceae bacterium]
MPVLLALLTAAAPAAATPIPEGPDGNPPP